MLSQNNITGNCCIVDVNSQHFVAGPARQEVGADRGKVLSENGRASVLFHPRTSALPPSSADLRVHIPQSRYITRNYGALSACKEIKVMKDNRFSRREFLQTTAGAAGA